MGDRGAPGRRRRGRETVRAVVAGVAAGADRPVHWMSCAQSSSVASDPAAYISASPERVAAKRLFWQGELVRARASLDALSALADERGDLTSYAMIRMHRVEAGASRGRIRRRGATVGRVG